MKKLILLTALLACVVAVGDVQGQEVISLESWCKALGHLWDEGTCFVIEDTLSYWGDQLYINADERLLIEGSFKTNNIPSIYNSGNIIVKGDGLANRGRIELDEGGDLINLGLFQNAGPHPNASCAEGYIENFGTIRNYGTFRNAYFGPKPITYCQGVINNYDQAAFYNFGELESDGDDFNNLGVIYYSICFRNRISKSQWGYFDIGGTHVAIENEICEYIPLASKN